MVPVHRNRDVDIGGSDLHAVMRARAAETGARVRALDTALADEGTDLGSNSVEVIPPARVALVGGDGISPYSFGAAWFAFDQRLRLPVTRVALDRLAGALDHFDVVVLPSMWGGGLDSRNGERLHDWVRDGGVLVTLDGATRWLTSDDGFARLEVLRDTVRDEAGRRVHTSVPGAIVRAVGDTLSPLLAGVTDRELPVMLSGDRVYQAPEDVRPGEVVLRYADADRLRLAGYLWPEVPDRVAGSPALWTERVGAGRIVAFTGDPNFRMLWRGLLPLFANAVMLSGSF